MESQGWMADTHHIMASQSTRIPSRLFAPASALSLCLLLCACPFASDRPLSDPANSVLDDELAGVWRSQDPESGEWHSIEFLPFDEHAYAALSLDQGSKIDAFRAFTTTIGAERFLNLRDLRDRGASWNFLNYRLNEGRLVLRLIDDALFESASFQTEEELARFVAQNLENPLLYGKDEGRGPDMVLERPPQP